MAVSPGKPSLCEDLVDRIMGMVRDGRFGAGAALPPERDLARELQVSRASVREALRTLSIMGVLETRHGSGSHVADSSVNVLRTSFQCMLILDRPTMEDLYETRELLEVHLAGRAAERRTEADLVAIEAAYRDLLAARGSGGAPDSVLWVEANARFHEAIARAGHCPVLERFMSCIHDGIRATIQASAPGERDWRESLAVHAQVLDAIRRRNPADARRAMTVHMGRALLNLDAVDHLAPLESL